MTADPRFWFILAIVFQACGIISLCVAFYYSRKADRIRRELHDYRD
jgi:hypothetical protein